MKRRAGFWERRGRLFVETTVHPGEGAKITSSLPTFFRELSAADPVDVIGQCVLDALAANYADPHLDYPTDILDTVYAAGLKSYGTFTRGARYVSASLEGERVWFAPTDGTTARWLVPRDW